MTAQLTRRSALKTLAGASALAATSSLLSSRIEAAEAAMPSELKHRIHHSVCKWCYPDISLEALCAQAASIGLTGIDLVDTTDIPTLQKYNLISPMIWGIPGGITKGLNRVEHHDAIVEFFEKNLPITAAAGFPNMICFSGNREGMNEEEGLKNCAIGLKRIMPLAEKHGVTLCMELLNSKVNHHDYMCDRTPWGVELCQRVGSERFKLLYDIYHMQIMEGDLISTIRQNHQYIAHYHTGGVPGRHEIDSTQEIYYPAVMEAILGTGFKGFVAQEFIPAKKDKIASLKEGVRICDV
jgi:hydroxypyruvate isomerase